MLHHITQCVQNQGLLLVRYAKEFRQEYILERASSSEYHGLFVHWEPYQHAMASANSLQKCNRMDTFTSWSNTGVDFTAKEYDPHKIISLLHSMCVIITGNASKYWPKKLVGLAVLESIKFCARFLVNTKHMY